jgi:hypothetical protein
VKGYKLIDISLGRLIIERSVQFKESVSHVPQQPHEDIFVIPPFRYDEHENNDSSSDESYDLEDSDDLDTNSVNLDAELVHQDADAEPEQRPKWAETTLHDVGNLIDGPIDNRRTWYDFKEPPLALTAT